MNADFYQKIKLLTFEFLLRESKQGEVPQFGS